MVAGRIDEWHGRIIFSFDQVPTKGGEAQVALQCIDRVAPYLPGAQAIVYDGALRGAHVHHLLRNVGLIPISPPTAARAETGDQPREEKIAFIETITTPSGGQLTLYGRGGQLGIGEFDSDGTETFLPLERTSIKRQRNTDGTHRWYGVYRLPDHHGGDTVMIRADTTDEDRKRKINRSENYRLMPPDDAGYQTLYPLRSDIEANNRQLEDTLWINRAHSVGAKAQLLDLLGYALLYNSVAIGLERARRASAAEPMAA